MQQRRCRTEVLVHARGRRCAVEIGSEARECPDHAGGAAVEVCQRQRRAPHVPFLRRPEVVFVPRAYGIVDECGDGVAHPRLVPRAVRQRLVPVGAVQHRPGL